MNEILSVKNTTIKEIKKLHKKKYRVESQQYLLEGFHLIEEAVKYNNVLTQVLVTQRGYQQWGAWLEAKAIADVSLVSDEVMKSISDLPTPQGILAVVAMAEAVITDWQGAWLLLDNVQDPGNVGTMVRTADAAGLSGIILGEGTADIYSTKTLRSMQGSHFHLPVVSMNLKDAISVFKEQTIPVYGTELNEFAVSYQDVSASQNFALIMGNEGQGVEKELLDLTDKNLYIPIKGHAESLNVGIAAGILMFHLTV
ncbi:23S rRNA methyltransferase [Enterococcus sp. JM4C]|uniref:TrmH family RNA methyltransferase n=1 Tax=Candidatus Enterococcus huntleyi TaxID=1857217 RepID=UPI00137A4C96|nr:RNA methyltransferase [Enterococcus sp. JM4C]KAF1295830.1 23S rRNA methyltransferase [Enterococcus sp. JM4C]